MSLEAPSPGSVIAGKYRVVGPLGAGGMGVVVEAVHLALGHRVAVKLVQGVRESKAAMARFLHEARVAAQLPGDHIGRAIDVGRTRAGEAFLVMELLVGRDLQAELDARRRIPVREAVDLILEACEGAAEAHAIGLVHRDLKPANLFLAQRRDGSRIVKVLDFGISKWTLGAGPLASTFTGSAAGTPAYMAPEQFDVDARLDARCDQHALAVVLYEMLAGAPPFVAESAYSLALLIARKAPRAVRELAPEVPPALEAAILRALSKSPEDRFPDLAAFARAIAPFGGEGARASLRNVSTILAAAAAVKVVTERRTVSPALPEKKEIPEAPSSAVRAAPRTLPSRALPPRGRPDDALPPLQVDQAAMPLVVRRRFLTLGPLAIAAAALAFTSFVLDTGEPSAIASSAPSPSPALEQRAKGRTASATAAAAPSKTAAPPTWIEAAPSQALAPRAPLPGALAPRAPLPGALAPRAPLPGALAPRAPLPGALAAAPGTPPSPRALPARPALRRAARPSGRGPAESTPPAKAPDPAPSAAVERTSREVFGARR